jgi:hypothetical protein
MGSGTVYMYGMFPARFKKKKAQLPPEQKPKDTPISYDDVVSKLLDHIEAMCDSPDTPPKLKVESIQKMLSDFRRGDWEDWLIPPKKEE